MQTQDNTWQKAAIDDLENTGLSYGEIGKKYGRSRDTIIKLKRLYNVLRRVPVARRGGRKAELERSISAHHRALGSRLTVFRANKTYTQVAEELGVSRHILKMMELGAHDFTLSQLLRIEAAIGHPVQDLITPISMVTAVKRTGDHDRKIS